MDQNSSGDQPPIDPQKAFSSPLPPPSGSPVPPAGNGSQGAAIPPRAGSVPPPGRPVMPPGMPPYPPMPMMYPPPPPQRPRHSFVRGILVTLATTIFGFSLMLNIYLLLFSGLLSGGASSKSTVLRHGELTQQVAVVKLEGVIMDDAFEKFDRLLNRVEDQPHLKALVIEIDSPGGAVTASDEIYNRLLKFRKEHPSIPVAVSMGSLATSGGYYAACAADYIVAQRTTMTGNIGVLLPRYNVSELAKRWGITENTIASSDTPFKNAGSMFKPEIPAETKYFQALIDDAFEQFKSVVRDGREGKLKKDLNDIANGKVYMSSEALTLGLIDQIGYLDDAIDYAAKTAGLSKPMAIRYEQRASLSDLLMGAESRTSAPSRGVTLNISPEMLDRIATPRLMYIWRGE